MCSGVFDIGISLHMLQKCTYAFKVYEAEIKYFWDIYYVTGLRDTTKNGRVLVSVRLHILRYFYIFMCRISVKSLRFSINSSSSDVDVKTFQN